MATDNARTDAIKNLFTFISLLISAKYDNAVNLVFLKNTHFLFYHILLKKSNFLRSLATKSYKSYI